ncbi:translation initiation factor IF-2 [Saprospiraceae bacterium]|nr:translation initiation factor IF-2 [Saprospiraceae bacterium]
MAVRLVKIAKELNVGTATIVDFLVESGFEIENKPTSKISDGMHDALLKEFSNSMAVKEKADQLVIGNRKEEPKQELEPPPPPEIIKPVEVLKQPLVEQPKVEEVTSDPPASSPKVTKPKGDVIEARASAPGLKVMGKVDLTPKKKKKEELKSAPVAKKEELKVEPKKAEPAIGQVTDKPKETSKSDATKNPEDIMVRAATPQLKGLKIMGKIDTKKFENPKKETPAEKKEKRKRTRTKVRATNVQGVNRGGQERNSGRNTGKSTGKSAGRSRRDEVKEVSKKEIDDKIKATLARLSGGGKKKRQKIRRDNREDKREKQEQEELSNVETTLKLTEFISVSELASIMEVGVGDVITTCMNLGVIVSINQRLDAEIIELVAEEFGHEVEFINADDQDDLIEEIVDDPTDLQDRAPIVTVMGHVDHGKTSLLDYIRNASVADGEAGGITQHIGAYEVAIGPEKKRITFLDTPGHEAFTAMRARGAKVTDIAIIIISADDRIMPQTKEAISHAQAAGVPMVFAINKIDKDGADPERIKQELASMNLLVEAWGGEYQSQDISAKKGLHIDDLLEKLLLQAEMLELKANPDRLAIGTVIEASLDKGRGYVTKLLVQTGTLKVGDPLVAGGHSGKVKAMFNEKGKRVKLAGPSTPVLVLGLSGAPQAGEKFKVMETEQEARQIATKRAQIEREQSNRASKRISLDEIGRRLALGTFKELNIIIKGDVDGSVEALADSLIKQSHETVQVNVIHKAVGQIVESDILLASASDAIVIGFQVRPSSGARTLAEREGVQIKTYSIIYEAIDEIKAAIEGMLEPTKEERMTAMVEVRETYKISKVGTIAGCYVTEGTINRNSHIRIIRDGIVVYPSKEGIVGELASLKRFKDDMKEVKFGFECGLNIKNFNDIKVGDMIEAYEIIEIKQRLD